jgi:aryl-alcohol dehydrogenase-like predicted oxidoreductase
MQHRTLGNTGLSVPILSFGASSLGAEFRKIDLNEALASVRVALDCGMNLIDTSPFYGRGMSEVLLGVALQDVPRESYLLGTKLGRYDLAHFDFSAKRVMESVDISLHRMRVDHLDICLAHDIEFVEMSQIVEETLPAMRKLQQQGKIRFVGISGYPMKVFQYVLERAPLDVILSYNHYTLQDRRLAALIPYLQSKGVGIINAAPFSARLLTNGSLPVWHKSPREVRVAADKAKAACQARGVDIAQLAVQFSIRNPEIATCVVGSANPENVRKWAAWAELPIDEELLAEVDAIFQPVMDIGHIEGRPENN